MKKFQARQGDVFIQEVDEIPQGLKPKERVNGDIILAYGEVTNHAHRIKDKKIRWFEGRNETETYLDNSDGNVAMLTHEEHSKVELPSGKKYIAIRQREYDELGERMVAD